MTVSRDACGNYYCSLVYDDAEQAEDGIGKRHNKRRAPHPVGSDGIVAFDLGIKT